MTTEQEVPPDEILVLTFTRAAVHELRRKIADELQPHGIEIPRISTLHSFALRQLIRNADRVTTVPVPVRIADDWEERNIILEDLKNLLNTTLINTRGKFNALSADWQTLRADTSNWEEQYSDPEFIGFWREHSGVYGYTLRLQLVYELKRALQHEPGFSLERHFRHVLVDEYQDLNPCDLAMVRELVRSGAELFAAGDDDQSIYGFRYADPEGIRRFDRDYNPCSLYELQYCQRCSRSIIRVGQFVVRLDPRRIAKRLLPLSDAAEGEVQLLEFGNQHEEADGLATVCANLIQMGHYQPGGILFLIRSDHQGVFSNTLRESLESRGIPVACRGQRDAVMDYPECRQLLSYLRLLVDDNDHLAWRTLLQVPTNLIGAQTISGVYDIALREGRNFASALAAVRNEPSILPRLGNRLYAELGLIDNMLGQSRVRTAESIDAMDTVRDLAQHVVHDQARREEILAYLQEVQEASEDRSLTGLLLALSTSMADKEQEIDRDKVNVITMHKAKGLTAEVVFLVGAEDEYIPGNQLGESAEGDECRLLYVSMTRPRQRLFITRCRRRVGQQKYTGRTSGSITRTLSRFLRDVDITARPGTEYTQSLGA